MGTQDGCLRPDRVRARMRFKKLSKWDKWEFPRLTSKIDYILCKYNWKLSSNFPSLGCLIPPWLRSDMRNRRYLTLRIVLFASFSSKKQERKMSKYEHKNGWITSFGNKEEYLYEREPWLGIKIFWNSH